MNDSAEHSNTSLVLSAFGWVLAVVAVAIVLFVGKPYYINSGFEAGRKAQAEANIKAVDAMLASREIEGNDYQILARVLSKKNGGLLIEAQNGYLVNPLRTEARQQTVRIDAQTVLEKLTMLPQDQYLAALEQARRNGVPAHQAVLYTTEPLTLDQIEAGTNLRIFPVVAQDAFADSFTAKKIQWLISNQVQSNPNTNQP